MSQCQKQSPVFLKFIGEKGFQREEVTCAFDLKLADKKQ